MSLLNILMAEYLVGILYQLEYIYARTSNILGNRQIYIGFVVCQNRNLRTRNL